MLYNIWNSVRQGKTVKAFGAVGRPSLMPIAKLAAVLDEESQCGKGVTDGQVRSQLQLAANAQEMQRGNSERSNTRISDQTVNNYMVALQAIGFAKDTEKGSIYKSAHREVSENSLIHGFSAESVRSSYLGT